MNTLISKNAVQDIENILTYTLENWGIKQFHKYKELLEEALVKIEANPELLPSKSRDDLTLGCRSYPVGKHIFFYRVKNNTLEVIRVLHQRMDIDAYFE